MSPRGPIETMKFILGTKGKMTTVYTAEGMAFAATVINATPNLVTQIKTAQIEGYDALQVGAGDTTDKHVNKAQLGHTKGKALKVLREVRPRPATVGAAPDTAFPEVGSTIDVSVFSVGDKVTVSAISKGRGFQGVVKRHGFHGGPRSHGQKHSERSPGSIGGGGRAGGRVAKGMRMAGRMGQERVSVRNLSVLQVHPATNEIVISGAVPGRKGTVVEIRA